MVTFSIFAIILTFAYIIYYGVMLTREIVKTSSTNASCEETLDVSDMIGLTQSVIVNTEELKQETTDDVRETSSSASNNGKSDNQELSKVKDIVNHTPDTTKENQPQELTSTNLNPVQPYYSFECSENDFAQVLEEDSIIETKPVTTNVPQDIRL